MIGRLSDGLQVTHLQNWWQVISQEPCSQIQQTKVGTGG
jgi:hypothetical protein